MIIINEKKTIKNKPEKKGQPLLALKPF